MDATSSIWFVGTALVGAMPLAWRAVRGGWSGWSRGG